MTRTRTRSVSSRTSYGTSYNMNVNNLTSVSESITDNLHGPGSCSHWKSTPITFRFSWDNTTPGSSTWYDNIVLYPSKSPMSLVGSELARLNWGKLPSSSEFGIIQILAEIDDTISMFALRFWKQLSYGSLNWGVIPFLQDCKSVIDTVNGLSADLANFGYEDQYIVDIQDKIDFSNYTSITYTECYGSAKVRLTGKADISFQNPASVALDRIGLHPDWATAWDLVPFSFVADYLLPIGDFLESFRQGGWIKAAIFTGWTTVKFDLQLVYCHKSAVVKGYRSPATNYTRFDRFASREILTSELDFSRLELKLPSLRQMFNMLYLLRR